MDAVIPLSQLGLGPVDAEDLRWFFCESEALLLRCPLGYQLDCTEAELPFATRTEPERGLTDYLMDAMARHRKIAARLLVIGRRHVGTLRRYYGPRLPLMLGAFRQYAGIAPSTKAALATTEGGARGRAVLTVCLRALSARYLGGTPTDEDRAHVRAILAEADTAYQSACAAYRRTNAPARGREAA